MFSVLLKPKAAKELGKLPPGIKDRIKSALQILTYEPVPFREYDVKKIRGSEGMYRIRLGEFRVIYAVEEEEKAVIILKIARRDETTYD